MVTLNLSLDMMLVNMSLLVVDIDLGVFHMFGIVDHVEYQATSRKKESLAYEILERDRMKDGDIHENE